MDEIPFNYAPANDNRESNSLHGTASGTIFPPAEPLLAACLAQATLRVLRQAERRCGGVFSEVSGEAAGVQV